MNSTYVGYAAVVVATGAVALWAGLPPLFLLLLLACPLMMFLMMRGGGHGGMSGRPDTSDGARRDPTDSSVDGGQDHRRGHR